ncbi:DUF3352 domain-containing protein [Conexibacter sp. JD483]|uniref:DUF3352 domain-containing protein n=1 Tax=unclassified Conexibacter TaxID=2627773 RepID=UPI002720AAC4|nr:MULTISPECIES: DUF3352 domain-containing protein [unclassified Conexibacter]MDO8184576.1 DUF3352 domain-containing protein [Conexibacter sp. CPCC 205706]MDO8197882.1 DUF3352 domain-containing protein [Conexibacter sp. CPCC 205762]MDR9370072.1 DUF3352 domain-containing protein [Conexibacter sp. JD483]
MGTARSRAPAGPPRTAAPRRQARRPLPPVLRDWRAGAGLLALIVAVVLAVVLLGGGSDGGGPAADRAAQLAPADALAWVHLSTDGDREAVQQALTLAGRAGLDSTLGELAGGLLGSGGGQPVDFARDVRPWLGDEAALAFTQSGRGTAGSLLLLAVADEDGARRFLSRTAGPARRGSYRGHTVSSYGNGTVAAFADGFLLVGQQATVRGALDRVEGVRGARTLADDPAYRRATAGQPADRALDAYATVAGVRLLLAPRSGPLGLLGALLDQPSLRAVALTVSAAGTSMRVRIRSDLDPSSRVRPATFAPTLMKALPRATIGYLGFPGLAKAAPLLLSLGGVGGGSATETLRLVQAAERTLRAQGVDFGRDLLPLLGGEVAVAIVPVGRTPSLVLLAKVRDEAAGAAGLRRLEPALARLFATADGAAPAFADAPVGGIAARRLDAGGGVELDYALADGMLALSTGAAPLAAVLRPQGSIDENPDYKAVIPDSQSELTSIVFFDFSQLLTFFEPLGLTADSGLGADLQRVRAVGLTSTGEKAQSTAELTFEIP